VSDELDGLDATEKAGTGATLNRCRALATKIGNDLRNKRPEHFVDKLSLAEIHASLKCASDVLATGRARRRGPTSGIDNWGRASSTHAFVGVVRPS
jgi:hypothetical protein